MAKRKKGDGAEVFAAAWRCAVIAEFAPCAGGAELAGGVKTSTVPSAGVSVHRVPAWASVVVLAAVSENCLG